LELAGNEVAPDWVLELDWLLELDWVLELEAESDWASKQESEISTVSRKSKDAL
jgi:hypothetical protein